MLNEYFQMNDVLVLDDVLSQEFMVGIGKFLKGAMNKGVWRTSHCWNRSLTKTNASIPILDVPQVVQPALEQLRIAHEFFNQISESSASLYVWGRGCGIPWHVDDSDIGSITIYLNDWSIDDGGLLLFMDENDEIRGIEPKANRAVFIRKGVRHTVTAISPAAKRNRVTLQMFAS